MQAEFVGDEEFAFDHGAVPWFIVSRIVMDDAVARAGGGDVRQFVEVEVRIVQDTQQHRQVQPGNAPGADLEVISS